MQDQPALRSLRPDLGEADGAACANAGACPIDLSQARDDHGRLVSQHGRLPEFDGVKDRTFLKDVDVSASIEFIAMKSDGDKSFVEQTNDFVVSTVNAGLGDAVFECDERVNGDFACFKHDCAMIVSRVS